MHIRNNKLKILVFLLGTMTLLTVAFGQAPPTSAPSTSDATVPTPSAPASTTSSSGSRESGITLNFNNMDMYEFSDQVATTLGLTPLVIDPSLQGTVSLRAPSLSRNDVLTIFNMILKSRGAVLIQQRGVYQILPIATAMKNGVELLDVPSGNGKILPSKNLRLATFVMRAEFVPVNDLVEPLQLFMTDGGEIIIYERLNMLIFTDYEDNAIRVQELVRMLDKSFLDPNLVELVKIEYNAAEDVAADLGRIFGSASGSGDGARAGSGNSGVSFVPLERLNAIFVMASSQRALGEAKSWIKNLDTNASSKFQPFSYVVQNSTASSIAAMLSALYGGDSSGSSSGSSSSRSAGIRGTGSQSGRSSSSSSGNSRFGSSSSSSSLGGTESLFSDSSSNSGFGSSGGSFGGSGQSLGPQLNTSERQLISLVLPGGGDSGLRDTVRIVADDVMNSLHIQATPADYRYLLETIRRMDVLPRQVSIDARIYEVDLTDTLSYGLRGELSRLGDEKLLTTAGMSDQGLLSLSTFAYFGDARQLTLALDALKAKTKVKILESPSLRTMDGTPANALVGAEVPYPAGTTYNNDYNTTNVEYRNTGIYLDVLPRISASGLVTLQLTLEVSNVGAGLTMGDQSAPTFPKTAVTTTLSVMDGKTVAIAGLIRDKNNLVRGGIPFLSEIPLVGGLFGATSNDKTRTELIIMLTPHVIQNPDKFDELTQELRDSLRNVRKFADEHEKEVIKDREDAMKDREKNELKNIRKIKKPRTDKTKNNQ